MSTPSAYQSTDLLYRSLRMIYGRGTRVSSARIEEDGVNEKAPYLRCEIVWCAAKRPRVGAAVLREAEVCDFDVTVDIQ